MADAFRGKEDIEFLKDFDPDLFDAFEERAGIIEEACNSKVVDRAEAERRAWILIVEKEFKK